MRAEWKAENGRYSFMAGGIGWRDRAFALEANGVALSSEKDCRFEDGAMVSRFTRERITVTRRTDLTIAFRRSIENVTEQPLRIRDIRDFTGTTPLALGGSPADCHLFHAEAIHEWGKYRICFHELARPPAQTPLKEGAPRAVFGATGWQPYTGICFARKGGGALVEGVLSQDRFCRYWAPRPDGAVEALFGMFGIEAKVLAPGETIETEEVYLEIQPRFDPADPFAAYNRALREVVNFHGQRICHYKDLIWGSWNDGIFTRVTDELVRKNAEFCKTHLPAVTWIQIDDGYSAHREKRYLKDPANPDTGAGGYRTGIWYAFDPGGGVDRSKFPDGLRPTAEHIARLGLRPAIWVGLHCVPEAQVVKDHPDWFQPCLGEDRATVRIPDYSIPACREAVKQAFLQLVRDCKYQGIKLDFWTYGFIANQRAYERPFRFAQGNKTGLEWMHEFLGWLRELLGDGYLEAGCDIAMGNPFLGRYFDNIRYGIDIGDGRWDYLLLCVRWMAFLAFTEPATGLLCNSDSIGTLRALGPDERLTWLHYCYVTGTLFEVAGDLAARCTPDELVMLQKITANLRNDVRIGFGDLGFLDGGEAPGVWLSQDAEGRATHVGFFNWSENETEVVWAPPAGDRPGELVDFWTDEPLRVEGPVSVRLRPHASRLFRARRVS